MAFKLAFHPAAERELNELLDMITSRAGPSVAARYIDDLLDFISELASFPKRGTIRSGKVEGLRIIGYRRRVSIGFVVTGDTVLILGVFTKGRNVTVELLTDRL